jgi:hypothetical protein
VVWVGKIGETRDLGRLRVRRDVDAPSLPNSSNSSSHSKSTATFVGGCGFVCSVMVCSCRVVVAAQARSDRMGEHGESKRLHRFERTVEPFSSKNSRM